MICGYQGEPGAFSETAAVEVLGDVPTRGFRTFEELVRAVDERAVDAGMLPVENSVAGPVARAYDLLRQHPQVRVVDEHAMPIVQCLIGLPGASASELSAIVSHPVALEQCRDFLSRLGNVEAIAVHDTAGAVREVVERGDHRCAAIGAQCAAERYGGALLARDVADVKPNVTRFFVVEREGRARNEPRRACVAFELPHEPGSLHRALGVLAEREMNLRSLVARPSGTPFEYTFYVEFDSDMKTAQVVAPLLGRNVHVLGCY